LNSLVHANTVKRDAKTEGQSIMSKRMQSMRFEEQQQIVGCINPYTAYRGDKRHRLARRL
jgi:hypothetical protein